MITKDNEKFMTIRQISEYFNVSEKTIRRRIKDLIPNKLKHGKLTKLSKNEVDVIIKSLQNEYGTVDKVEVQSSRVNMNDVMFSIKALADTVNISMQGFDNRLKNIENKYEEKKALLPAPEKSDRDNLNQIVRAYVRRNDIFHAIGWNILYNEALYRMNVNIKVCAEHRGISPLNYAEEKGLIPQLLSIAMELFNKD